ncbi:FAD-dependent thymidylate synthase [Paraconexibacter antarcticus]|uniref:FAD-dependent thymidylate synthase n=1 Tax=Paraconexibacter antarcticus TaxID=2949664 RepID=A0ABY5DPY9_9ACTN|nr:FAD-dependent thymidylate synthase [Paraconexibacter antarcticus]UTI64098.1 FAD-dependent thymidylate synthase [Paraconexibacter antarcticus]
MDYPVESFTPAEQARLAPHVTNLDRPVFALTNLPETVKGAMFARYSRYQGTLRRMFLDEFADSLPEIAAGADDTEGTRAAELYERIFVGYGDDSVAQLGGAHVACEWVSNVLTKVLQRPRLGAYLEQSTRYIPYDTPMGGADSRHPRYRYYRDPSLGPVYEQTMDEIFGVYSGLLPKVRTWVDGTFPGDPGPARDRAIGAKALDLVRGLLPAASLSHMGIYATGQTYEQLILHLLAHPLPEARECGTQILDALQHVMPSFVSRIPRPDRGGEWIGYLQQRDEAAARWVTRLGLDRPTAAEGSGRPSVRLLHVDGDEDALLAALLFEASGVSEEDARIRLSALSTDERIALLTDLVGERRNRRHRPGRGYEALRYRFEIVSDYGAFRDLQRHRMLTVQWQKLTPGLGAGVPEEIDLAGAGGEYRHALELSRVAHQRLLDDGHDSRVAMYALCLGYRIRYVLDLNAREAMQLIELRSGREGHPSYRAVAHEMHRHIAAVHPAVAGTMIHVDGDVEPRLERILSEMRTQNKLDQLLPPTRG